MGRDGVQEGTDGVQRGSAGLSGVQRVVEAKSSARVEQRAIWDSLPRRLRRLLMRVETVEASIGEGEMHWRTIAPRPRGQYRLRLRWETSRRGVVGFSGPYWVLVHGEQRRVRRPNSRVLRSVYPDQRVELARAARDRLDGQIKEREAVVEALARAVDELPPARTQELLIDPYQGLSLVMPEWVRERIAERRRVVEQAIQSIYDIAFELETIEARLDKRMEQFNKAGGWHRNLLVRWKLDGRLTRSVLKLRGPELCRIFTNRDRRFYERLAQFAGCGARRPPKGEGGRPERVVSEDRILQGGQRRYKAHLLRVGKAIEEDAVRREKLGRVLQRTRYQIERVERKKGD